MRNLLLPGAFIMRATGNNVQRHTGTAGQQRAGNRKQRFRAIGMIGQLQTAVVDVHAGVSTDGRICNDIQDAIFANPEAGEIQAAFWKT